MSAVRTQTTINVNSDVLGTIDELSRISGVSRSKLFDLAARQFASWATSMNGNQLRLLAEAKVNEPVSGYVRKVTPEEIAKAKEVETAEAIAASEMAIARSMGISLDNLRRTPIGQLTTQKKVGRK